LISFVDGLAEDAEAVANGCSESWSNGMVEGFINNKYCIMLLKEAKSRRIELC
jgi:transposase